MEGLHCRFSMAIDLFNKNVAVAGNFDYSTMQIKTQSFKFPILDLVLKTCLPSFA